MLLYFSPPLISFLHSLLLENIPSSCPTLALFLVHWFETNWRGLAQVLTTIIIILPVLNLYPTSCQGFLHVPEDNTYWVLCTCESVPWVHTSPMLHPCFPVNSSHTRCMLHEAPLLVRSPSWVTLTFKKMWTNMNEVSLIGFSIYWMDVI